MSKHSVLPPKPGSWPRGPSSRPLALQEIRRLAHERREPPRRRRRLGLERVAVPVPGFSKTLPAGSYLASGTILASVFTTSGPGLADIKCVLTDTPSDGSALLSYTTRWLGPATVPAQTGKGEMPTPSRSQPRHQAR